MPRPRSDFAAVHGEASRIEPDLARAVQKALARVRDGLSINELAMALAAKDARRALALVPKVTVADALSPAGTIVRDTVLRGGRLGADVVNKPRRRRR